MRYILISFTIFLFVSTTRAQQNNLISIKGKVVDEQTGAPLEDVNIFLSNTTIGTSTGKNGKFVISNVPFGTYNIIFSYIGYETEKRNFYAYKPEPFEFNISLKRKAINLKQVNISGTIPKDWKENLKVFTKIFLGATGNAKDTKILNPEVLDLTINKKTGILNAHADSVVRVENMALGYMLYIVLDSLEYVPYKNYKYMFYPRFKELTPVSEEEIQTWETNRQQTYLDSPKHFFYALVHKQLDKDYYALHEGTLVSLMNGEGTSILPEDLNLTCNRDSSLYILNFTGGLKVSRFLNSSSYLNFFYPSVSIDKYGNLLSSFFDVEIFGAWANLGIADLLPENYLYREK